MRFIWGDEDHFLLGLWKKQVQGTSSKGINDCYFEINKDDRVVDVATYFVGNSIEVHLYVEHNVKDIKIKVVEPQCI